MACRETVLFEEFFVHVLRTTITEVVVVCLRTGVIAVTDYDSVERSIVIHNHGSLLNGSLCILTEIVLIVIEVNIIDTRRHLSFLFADCLTHDD